MDVRGSMVDDGDDDDMPVLSAHALAALNEFLTGKEKRVESEEEEDWQLSQFWYTDETARSLAEEALDLAAQSLESSDGTARPSIACLSVPSSYRAIKKVLDEKEQKEHNLELRLFEFDKRLGKSYPDEFVHYDYNHPTRFEHHQDQDHYKGHFDVLLLDPPFLNEEVLSAFLESVRYLAKPTARVLIVTGSVLAEYLLAQPTVGDGTWRVCGWRPRHQRLSNEFYLYTNYASARFSNPTPLAPATPV